MGQSHSSSPLFLEKMLAMSPKYRVIKLYHYFGDVQKNAYDLLISRKTLPDTDELGPFPFDINDFDFYLGKGSNDVNFVYHSQLEVVKYNKWKVRFRGLSRKGSKVIHLKLSHYSQCALGGRLQVLEANPFEPPAYRRPILLYSYLGKEAWTW